jgi:hypothetical protein
MMPDFRVVMLRREDDREGGRLEGRRIRDVMVFSELLTAGSGVDRKGSNRHSGLYLIRAA